MIVRKAHTGEPGNPGQFGTHGRDEATATLTAGPTHGEVREWLGANELTLPDDAVQAMVDMLAENDSTIARVDAYRTAHLARFGYSHEAGQTVRAVVKQLRGWGDVELADAVQALLDDDVVPTENPSAEYPSAVPVASASVQRGVVHDQVIAEDGTVFHRLRDGVEADAPYAIRVQANRPLSDEELTRLAGLTEYALASSVRGEATSEAQRDSPYSFIVGHDSTKGNPDRFDVFETQLPIMAVEGTPVRVTDRAGAGTRGTRAIDGMPNGGDLEFAVYYDQVYIH